MTVADERNTFSLCFAQQAERKGFESAEERESNGGVRRA
jgi:hypothetical protein